MVGRYRLLPEPLRKLMSHSFHQPTRVDEYQRSFVPLGQFHYPVQRLRPQLVARNRTQLGTRHLDSQIDLPGVPGIYYQAVGSSSFSSI